MPFFFRKAVVPNVQNLGHDLAEYEGDLEAVMANLATVSRAQALINCSNNQVISMNVSQFKG